MEQLSWQMKLRIAAALGIGIVLIGILAWPLAAPYDPLGAVRAENLSLFAKIGLMLLAVVSGIIACLVCWPYGREIAVLATPAGLAVWALRSGNLGTLIQLNPSLKQRQILFTELKWEPIFWLVIVGIGFAGVLLTQKILSKERRIDSQIKHNLSPNSYLNAIIGTIGSGLIASFCITILAQDVKIADSRVGYVMAQPAVGQMFFAVAVSFGLAAFIVKSFLNVDYLWPTIACAFVTPFSIYIYAKQPILEHLIQNWPPLFFASPALAILPVQIVAWGTLGSITGYWLAVRYNYLRRHKTE